MALQAVAFLSIVLMLSAFVGADLVVKRQVALTPTCGQSLYTGIVNENSPPGTQVVSATASSPVGNQLVWSIQDTTFQRFSINPATGTVSVAGSLARAALQRSAIEFRIRATDSSNQLYCESTVRVNVLPTSSAPSPSFPTAFQFTQNPYSFTATSGAYGTQVGQVSVGSANGQYVTYSISGSQYFAINAQTGIITAAQNLQPGVYTFTVNAQSSLGTATTTVTVNVTGTGGGGGGSGYTPPTFSQTSYAVSIASCTAGTQVAQVQAGGSANTPTQYSLSGTSQFTIDPNSGLLTLSQNLNAGSYTFQIYASNIAGQASATVTVQVSCPNSTNNNGAYYFTSGSCPAGSQLGAICAQNYG